MKLIEVGLRTLKLKLEGGEELGDVTNYGGTSLSIMHKLGVSVSEEIYSSTILYPTNNRSCSLEDTFELV